MDSCHNLFNDCGNYSIDQICEGSVDMLGDVWTESQLDTTFGYMVPYVEIAVKMVNMLPGVDTAPSGPLPLLSIVNTWCYFPQLSEHSKFHSLQTWKS